MLYINGRFLTQRITGVQRVGVELVKELDKIVKPGEVEILTPPNRVTDICLKNIKITEIGNKSNNWWVQWIFPIYVMRQRGESLTLTGIAPIIVPGYLFAHDVTFIRYPGSFSRKFRIIYNIAYKLTLKRSRHLFTVSEFSKQEISDLYRVNAEHITVIYNSSHQLLTEDKEEVSLDKWGLEKKGYCLSVSSKNIHKNQKYIIELAKLNPDKIFVIAGGSAHKSFINIEYEQLKNVVITGYVTDNELYNIYKNAQSFIFPSLYEGFGIPPLEAITLGVKHIAVSDIPVFHEVFSRGVYFFDPNNEKLFEMKKFESYELNDDDFKFYWKQYSWQNGARTLLEKIRETEQDL